MRLEVLHSFLLGRRDDHAMHAIQNRVVAALTRCEYAQGRIRERQHLRPAITAIPTSGKLRRTI